MSQLRLIPKPYVGLAGGRNTLQVRNLDDRLVIRLAPRLYFLVLFILLAASGGLPFIALNGLPGTRVGWLPHYLHFATWAFAALTWHILFRYLHGMPRIEIPKGSDEIQFFKYRGSSTDFKVRWAEVHGFKTTDETIGSRHGSYLQHVLYLVKKSGDPVPLCGSVNEKIIMDLQSELEELFRIHA